MKKNLGLFLLAMSTSLSALAEPSGAVDCKGLKDRLVAFQNANSKFYETAISTTQDTADVFSSWYGGWSQNEGKIVHIPVGFFSNVAASANTENENVEDFKRKTAKLNSQLNSIVVDVVSCLSHQ